MVDSTDAEPQSDLRIDILGPLEVHRGVRSVCWAADSNDRFSRCWSLRWAASFRWIGSPTRCGATTSRPATSRRSRRTSSGCAGCSSPSGRRVIPPSSSSRHREAGTGWMLPPAAVDAARFEAEVERGREPLEAGDAAAAAETLGDALALWRGDVLSDLAALEPIAAAAQRLGEVRMAAIEDWATAELALGHHAALVPQLASLEAAHPLRERLTALRMVALYRFRSAGRGPDGLRRDPPAAGRRAGRQPRRGAPVACTNASSGRTKELARSAPGASQALLAATHPIDPAANAPPATTVAAPAPLTEPAPRPSQHGGPAHRRRGLRWPSPRSSFIASTLASTGITRAQP